MYGRRSAPLIAALLTTLAVLSAAPARAGWWDDLGGAKETDLADLRRDPRAWLDVPVRLSVRFHGPAEGVNPFFTRFTAAKWQPIAVLPPLRGRPGEREALAALTGDDPGDQPYRRVFLRRGSSDDLRLPDLTSGETLTVRGVVRDATGDEPWIEVLTIARAGDPALPEEQAEIRRAERFLERRNAAAAAHLFRRILDGRPLPRETDALVRGRLGTALYELRDLSAAQPLLAAGLRVHPTDREMRRRLDALEEIALRRGGLPSAPTASSTERPDGHDVVDLGDAVARPTSPAPKATPKPRLEPLGLPGTRAGLSGPAGLDANAGRAAHARPSAGDRHVAPTKPAPTTTSTKRGAPRLPPPVTPPPVTPPPVTPPRRATPPQPARKPAPDADEEQEEAPPQPPPVPPRARLSGPR